MNDSTHTAHGIRTDHYSSEGATMDTNIVVEQISSLTEQSATAASASDGPAADDSAVLSWDFEDGDLVMIVWQNPEAFERAPWMPLRGRRQDLGSAVGCSVGFAYDIEEGELIVLFPHQAEVPAINDTGEVFIPYAAIRIVLPLDVRFPRDAYPTGLTRVY